MTGRKKWKRPLALFMLMVWTFLTLFGCQNGGAGDGGKNAGSGDKNADTAKGRYIEEDMELPLQDGEEILNLIKSKDGNPVLFAQANDTQVKRYEYDGKQWNQASLDWFTGSDGGEEIFLMEVQEDSDGMQYVRWIKEDAVTHITKGGEGKEAEELAIPYLTQQTEYGPPLVTGFEIDGAGNYWLHEAYASKAVVIDRETMEVAEEINTPQILNMSQHLLFPGEGTMAVNTEENVYTVYDESREVKGSLPIKITGEYAICGDKDHWYVISEEGITRFTVGNDIREVLMDGSMGAMGSAANSAVNAMRGNEEDFYVLYSQDKISAHSLKHYIYDPDAASAPEKTLRVFGLSDNDTIREAAMGFQKKYPDVKVEFTTSGKQAGEVTSDDIRTLNTELLSGNGADVLLLDGLPVDAYIEKGILKDLSDTAQELMEEKDYLENMLKNTAEKDGKIYGLPVKFYVPVIYGGEESKKALESLESLKAFLEADPSASVFGIADRLYIRDFLFELYQDEIFGEDGKVNQENLAELLELAEKIAINAKAALFDEELENGGSDYARDPFSNFGAEGIINYPEGAATAAISSISSMMIPYTVMRLQNLTPDTIQGIYLPKGIVGVNRNTSQPEIANDFVKYLFSEEVQGAQLDDGFPVLKSALSDKKNEVGSEYADSYYMMSSWNFEGEEPIELEAGYPTLEEVEDLIQKCDSLTTPSEQNRVIWNLYQEEADQFMKGLIDAAEAAENVARKVDTYLAE